MAEGLRKIAKALYKRKSGEEEKEVVEFLSKLDFVLGEVSVQEFKKKECVESPNEELLKELCSKSNGGLDFFDVLVVFYHSKKAITILRCDACRLLIFGPSFSCSDCFSSSDCSSHTLCCDCYGGGEAILHDHPAAHFFHDQRLLGLRLNPAKVSSQGQNRKGGEGGMSSVARAYYERSSDDEKKKAREFFGTIDANGDGNISLAELKNVLDIETSVIEKLFQAVDSDGDGALNFVEGLALYYSCKSIIGYVPCDGCKEPILGPYFSCTLCVHRHPRTFDLCCDCYRGGKVEHEHPYSDFLHNQVLLSRLMGTHAKGEMEEVRQIAKLHLEAATPTVARAAKEFFDSMDSNGDGKVDVEEFMSFMSEQGDGKLQQLLCNIQLFKFLDADGNGELDFSEVMMLFYVIISGRPNCDGCSALIPGTFFACLRCSYTLCCPCYDSKDHPHAHDGTTVPLLDNYSLLYYMRQSNRRQLGDEPPSSSRPKVELARSKTSKREVAYKALKLALDAANIATQVASCVIS